MYLSIIFLLLCLSAFFLLIEEHNQKWNNLYYGLIGLCLILVAAFRPEGMDNDLENYISYIYNYDDPGYALTVEWSFRMISKFLVGIFGSYRSVLLLYAGFGVCLKMAAVRKLFPLLFAPICIYIGNYFILHEFTQIRAGVASGILLLALYELTRHHRIKFILTVLIATFFHYSAIIFLPVVFLPQDTLSTHTKVFWAMIIPVGYVMYMIHLSITSLPIPYFGDKLEAYKTLRDNGFIDMVNVFNLVLFARIAVYYILLYFSEAIEKHLPIYPLFIRLFGLSIFSFLALSDLPVLSFRISELFGIAELIIFPAIIYIVKPQWAGKIASIAIGLFYLVVHSFIDQILVVM